MTPRILLSIKVVAVSPKSLAWLVPLIILYGCGAGSETKDEPKPTEEGRRTATVQQYASVVARSTAVADNIAVMETCDWFSRGALDPPGSIVCMASLFAMEMRAFTLADNLERAANEDLTTFIGTPPVEIARLVSATNTKANDLYQAARVAGDSDCAEVGTGDCLALRASVFKAMGALSAELDGWKPYF